MKENYEKYATLLLKRCIHLKKDQPLLITAPIETYEFVRKIVEKAYELGATDVMIDWEDEELMHQQLIALEPNQMKQYSYWNKQIYNEYASKNGAVLVLKAANPDKMKDVDPNLVSEMQTSIRKSYPIYREKQLKYEIPWCIASVSTEGLAQKIFPNQKNAKELLWNKIFEICHVTDENPEEYWNQKIKRNNERTIWLESLNLTHLHYKNALGTDLTIELSLDSKWYGTEKKTPQGSLIVNMPGEEVFTSPIRTGTSGIVYSSKPLVYGGSLIDKFSLTFEDGKVIKVHAETGEKILKNIVTKNVGANMLGEVALVDYHSPISLSNLVFYNTLYDENASCHLALGDSFPDTLPGGSNLTKKERLEKGLNQSSEHVDFMIGTKDLIITGITKDGKEIPIFKNGDFVTIN